MNSRAQVYYALVEALAKPPAWLALPGREWPLYESVKKAGHHSRAARFALEMLAQIGAESLAGRQGRYERLFRGPGRPRFWLSESLQLSGKMIGPATFSVQRYYGAVGMEPIGAELADHACLELAFLGHVAEQQVADSGRSGLWRRLERRFLKEHAGKWLPDLGRDLADCGDAVYAPIGRMLANWMAEALHSNRQKNGFRRRLPVLQDSQNCTLCGFCVQICVTRALEIREDRRETVLLLSPDCCTGCEKCIMVCTPGVLRMVAPERPVQHPTSPQLLVTSPRARCPACGAPTVSQAELNYMADQLGHPSWLNYCLSCRVEVGAQAI